MVCLVDYRLIQRMAVPIYVLNILALLALRFIGHKAKGAESWFVLGPVRVQPAEFMKIGVMLMLAKVYHDDFKPNQEAYGLLRLWKPLLVVGIPAVLVLVQPDLGTAMMILLSSATVILFGKVRWYLVAVMRRGLLAAGGIIWNDYVREAPEPRTHRAAAPAQETPEPTHLRVAGSRGGPARQRLPRRRSRRSPWAAAACPARAGARAPRRACPSSPSSTRTSSSPCGPRSTASYRACCSWLLYGGLFSLSLAVGFNARDRFGAFVAVGITAMIFWQVFENIGMVIGLLPVTGITLPLMSYGGSSIMSMMLSVGLLVNISMRRHMF